MKLFIFFLLISISINHLSCTPGNQRKETVRVIGSVPVADTIKERFDNIHFASKYDTSCGMPLAAGIEDTLQYKGKIYGFCSKECKEEFINKLRAKKK